MHILIFWRDMLPSSSGLKMKEAPARLHGVSVGNDNLNALLLLIYVLCRKFEWG
jgi:hypothetical protein